MYATFGTRSALSREHIDERKVWNEEELVERAIASGDEHAIKFTEVCLREHALNPDAAFYRRRRSCDSYAERDYLRPQ